MEAWFVSERILTDSQVALAQREAARLGLSFSEVVQRLGLVTGEELSLYRSVRGQLRTASDFIQEGQDKGNHLSLRRLSLNDTLRSKLSMELCQSLAAVPVDERDGVLWVASSNPFDLPTLKRLETAAGQRVEALPASETDIRLAINRNYAEQDELYDAVGAFIQMDAALLDEQSQDDPPMIHNLEIW